MLQSYFRYSLLGPYNDPASDGYEQVPSQKEGLSCDTVGNRHACGCVCLHSLFHGRGVRNKHLARPDSSRSHLWQRELSKPERNFHHRSPSLVKSSDTEC